MANEIVVPSLGESVTEATVSKWLKRVGENVASDEPLVELETDKVNVEVPSPLDGTLSSIKVKEGGVVEVGALLGVVSEGKSTKKEITKSEEKSYKPPKKIKKKETLKLDNESKEENSNGALVLDTLAEEEVYEKKDYIPPKTKKHLSPSVRKYVKENEIDISNIEGTGKAGRISKGDIINLMGNIPGPSKR